MHKVDYHGHHIKWDTMKMQGFFHDPIRGLHEGTCKRFWAGLLYDLIQKVGTMVNKEPWPNASSVSSHTWHKFQN